ncbi:mechanosensitive ion channel family protein [Luteibaculum oceani]|uniref:Mechanosensitive ion channel n=1 Tax=Luteibaculum oceani TaxID=1294296 RepID=A0A5C6VIM0_9FLAO|nr:mechanosensitive ion channel domain-containing protein [Luteibaculum oceani]TXC85243.1 mechanosensitive ion channel [Luteibaculum oceani]
MEFSIASQITQPLQKVGEKLQGWITEAITMLPNLLAGAVCYLFFWLVARAVKRILGKAMGKYSDNKVLQNLFTTIAYYSVLGLGFFVVLEILKLEKTVTSLLAGVGVIGLALSFAFQDIAANFISGIILAFRRPFQVDQIVEIGGVMGTVSRTNLRVTVITTFQGQEVYIPNKDVLQNPITNYSILGQYRIDLAVGVSYGDDLEKVEELVIDTIKNLDGVIRHEDMIFTYTGFGSSSVDFEIKFWIEYPDHPGFLEMRNKAIKAVKKAFDKNEITIPFPIRTLDFGIKGGADLSQMSVRVLSKEKD